MSSPGVFCLWPRRQLRIDTVPGPQRALAGKAVRRGPGLLRTPPGLDPESLTEPECGLAPCSVDGAPGSRWRSCSRCLLLGDGEPGAVGPGTRARLHCCPTCRPPDVLRGQGEWTRCLSTEARAASHRASGRAGLRASPRSSAGSPLPRSSVPVVRTCQKAEGQSLSCGRVLGYLLSELPSARTLSGAGSGWFCRGPCTLPSPGGPGAGFRQPSLRRSLHTRSHGLGTQDTKAGHSLLLLEGRIRVTPVRMRNRVPSCSIIY